MTRPSTTQGKRIGDSRGSDARAGKAGARPAGGAKVGKAAFKDGVERTDRDRQQRTTTGTFVAVGNKGGSLDAAAAKARTATGNLRRAAHPDGKVGSAKGTGAKAGANRAVGAKKAPPGADAKGADAKGIQAKGAEAKGDAKPALKGAEAKGDAKPALKGADAKGEAKAPAKAEAKADAKPAEGAKTDATPKAKPDASAQKAGEKAAANATPDGAARANASATPQKGPQTTSANEGKGAATATKGEGAASSSAGGAAGKGAAAAAGGGAHGAKIDGPQKKREVEGAVVSDRPAGGKADASAPAKGDAKASASGAAAAGAKPGAAPAGQRTMTSSVPAALQRSANAPAPLTTDAKLATLTKGVGKAEVAETARGLLEGKLDGEITAAAIAQRESDIADALSAGTEIAHATKRASADAEAFADVAAAVRADAAAIDGLLLDDDGREVAASQGFPFVRPQERVGIDFPVITTDMKLMANVLASQRMDASDIVSDLEMSAAGSDADGGGDEGGGGEGGEE